MCVWSHVPILQCRKKRMSSEKYLCAILVRGKGMNECVTNWGEGPLRNSKSQAPKCVCRCVKTGYCIDCNEPTPWSHTHPHASSTVLVRENILFYPQAMQMKSGSLSVTWSLWNWCTWVTSFPQCMSSHIHSHVEQWQGTSSRKCSTKETTAAAAKLLSQSQSLQRKPFWTPLFGRGLPRWWFQV